jgi:single-stranded DNA-binding protein
MSKAGKQFGLNTLAVDDGYGENKKTHYINLMYFGKPIEFTSKGDLVYVELSPDVNAYVDRNGEAKGNINGFVKEFKILQSKTNNNSNNNKQNENNNNDFEDPFADLDSELSDENPFGDVE